MTRRLNSDLFLANSKVLTEKGGRISFLKFVVDTREGIL